jgi:hypothetical protein
MLGFSTRPDDTGECWFEPADLNLGANDLARQMVIVLGGLPSTQPTVKHGLYGSFRVPKNYVGTPKVVWEWAATLTTGDVVFDFDYNSLAVGETTDPAAWQQSLTVTDTVAGTARLSNAAEVSLTAANLAVDDVVEFFYGRDGADGADTLAGRAYVVAIAFEYADV